MMSVDDVNGSPNAEQNNFPYPHLSNSKHVLPTLC